MVCKIIWDKTQFSSPGIGWEPTFHMASYYKERNIRHKQQPLRFCSVYNLMRDIDVEMEWVWGDARYAFVCRMLRRSGFEYKSKETPYTVIAQEVVTSCTSGPYLAEDVTGSLLLLATAHLMFRDLCMCKENPLLIIILLTVWLTLLYPACVAKLVHPSENSITPPSPKSWLYDTATSCPSILKPHCLDILLHFLQPSIQLAFNF